MNGNFLKMIMFFTFILLNQIAFSQNQLKEGSLEFSFDLYNKLKTVDENENIFFSPLSISTAFALPYYGATGLTKQQIQAVFNFDVNQKKNLKIYRDYTNALERSKYVTLRIANGLWLEEGLPINAEFLQGAKQIIGQEEIYKTNFIKNYKASRSQINDWIATKTDGNIKDLLPEDAFNDLTRFVIANAVYFQGDWGSAFDKKLTASNSFYSLNKTIETQFMTKAVADHNYYENDDVQVLELPYKGNSTSMVIVLPRFKNGFTKVENALNETTYQQWLKGMSKRPVVVTIPKFSLKIDYDLRATFRKMKLTEPFSDAASFDGISSEGLRLSKAYHQAFIVVSETGTTATASTAIVGTAKGLRPKPAFFNANQPFFFFIKDNSTNMILFMGRMTEPKYDGLVTYTTEQPPRYPPISTPISDKIHWVEKGESLYGISKKYGVTIDQIKRLNNLTDNNVKLGQELLIQEGENTTKGIGHNATTATATEHVVNIGESLFSIAKKYNLTIDKLKALNNMADNTIFIGQKLIVKEVARPKPTVEQPIPPKPVTVTQKTYIVEKGETLWKISQKFKIPVEELKKMNNLTSNEVSVGQELKVR